MEYTRNSDLTHYERNPKTTNCGSYALRLNEWYHLNLRFEEKTGEWIEDWAYREGQEGIPDEELTSVFEDVLLECLLEDFEGELEICNGAPPTSDDIELIAFNVYCTYDDEYDLVDSDFHFRVFRDGVWKEKCGGGNVHECNINHWGLYIGEAVYLYHKIK